MNESANDPGKVLLRHLGNHYVTITGSYAHTRSDFEGTFTYSACVVQKGDNWFVLTAGHAIADLRDCVESGRIVITGRNLVDHFGTEARDVTPIPFDPLSAVGRVINDEAAGLDYALLQLPFNTRQLLQANGLDPYPIKVKGRPPNEEFTSYCVAGFPEEKVESEIEHGGPRVKVIQEPNGIVLIRQPDDGTAARPRFHGHIGGPITLRTSKGMSGGPIFGFVPKDAQSQSAYLIAVQHSKGDGDSPSIFGSLIDEIWDDVASSSLAGGENTIPPESLQIKPLN